jgi:hypothetical protein
MSVYEYCVINEHTGERLAYRNTEREAKAWAEDEAVRHGSQRISVWKRAGTYESLRSWK